MRTLLLTIAASLALLGCRAAAAPAEAAPVQIETPAPVKCPPLDSIRKLREWTVGRAVYTSTGKMPAAILIEGFARLCAGGDSLICTGGTGRALTLAEVTAVDISYRARFEYRSDFVEFGRGDYWTEGAVTCGDCEDYALGLAELLHQAGAGGETMRLVVWSPFADAAHATLLVETVDAGEIEIGVGSAEPPHAMDWAEGRRFATIRFDGARALEARPGYWCDTINCYFEAEVPRPAR